MLQNNYYNNYIVYKLSMTHKRFEAMQNRLSHKIEVLEKDDEFTHFELRVESSLDILSVYHSGVEYAMKNLFDKIN